MEGKVHFFTLIALPAAPPSQAPGPHISMASLALRTLLVRATTTMLDVTSTNSTDTTSSETSTDLLIDRISLIAATTLLGFAYGVATILYCMTAYSLLKKLFQRNARSGSHPYSLSRSRTGWYKSLFYFIYTSVLFVLATLYIAGISHSVIVAYVDNRLFPGGPYQYFTLFMASQPLVVMTDVVGLIILWITDGLILYRFIVFYYHVAYAIWIIPLPCAMYVGVIVLSTLVFQAEAGLGKILYLSENMLLDYYVLSFSLNVVTTVLIAARLYWHKVQLQRLFGSRMETPYMQIATILIESAAFYGVWSLIFLILCVMHNPGQTIVLVTVNEIQVIAPLMIILWIARGNAWNDGKGRRGYDGTSDQLPSSGIARLSFGSRPTRVVDELGVDDVRPSTSRNVSRSTVTSGGGAKRGDGNGNVIELASYGHEASNVTVYGMKA